MESESRASGGGGDEQLLIEPAIASAASPSRRPCIRAFSAEREATSSPSESRSHAPPQAALEASARASERDTEGNLRIPGITVNVRIGRAIERAFVHGTTAHIHPAVARDVVSAEPASELIVVVVIRDERAAVKDACVRLDHWYHVEDVASFRADPLQNRFGEKPRLVVEPDLQPIEEEVAEPTADDEIVVCTG